MFILVSLYIYGVQRHALAANQELQLGSMSPCGCLRFVTPQALQTLFNIRNLLPNLAYTPTKHHCNKGFPPLHLLFQGTPKFPALPVVLECSFMSRVRFLAYG